MATLLEDVTEMRARGMPEHPHIHHVSVVGWSIRLKRGQPGLLFATLSEEDARDLYTLHALRWCESLPIVGNAMALKYPRVNHFVMTADIAKLWSSIFCVTEHLKRKTT